MKNMRAIVVGGLMGLMGGCTTLNHLNVVEGIHEFRTHHYHDAFVRLKPEAIKGQPDAQYAIGYMYYYGEGIVEDRAKAVYWIRRAACGGQQEAAAALKLIDVEYACESPKNRYR